MSTSTGLSTQLLVQFLASVSGCSNLSDAVLIAAEKAAAAFEGEVGAVVLDGDIEAVGFPRGAIPREELLAVVARQRRNLIVPGVGSCVTMTAPLESADGHLIVARSGNDGFAPEESNLLLGMARTFDMVLVMLRTLDAERSMRERSERHAAENIDLLTSLQGRHYLLEQLMSIQRAISRRAPLDQILNSIVSGAHGLLSSSEVASLCLIDPEDPRRLQHISSCGLPEDHAVAKQFIAEARQVSARAVAADQVVISSWTSAASDAHVSSAAMAAPVHESGRPVGALVVASTSSLLEYAAPEEATLAAFAEHVSLALTDARTLEDVRLAHHDPLTGLASRRLFMDRLQQALNHARRTGNSVALLFVDLDRFKAVNDTRGHEAGDRLLTEIATRVLSCLRVDDSAARLGGDEFAILLQGIDRPALARDLAERVLAAVRRPVHLDGRPLFIDASIGLVVAAAGYTDAGGLVRDADVAMYEAKRGGAGRTAIFEPRMRDRFQRRAELEGDLRQAVAADEFRLQYQPMIDIATNQVVSVEALLRWAHPRLGIVAPLSFIPMAEETGLIVPVGEWVLRQACIEASSWAALLAPDTGPAVSINMSGRQMQESDIADQTTRALADAGLDPGKLIIEITESVLLNDDPSILKRLNELKNLGVRLAIDDFGAGYSSLSYLRSFPVDILKIDKSFVDAIGFDRGAANFARAIVGLGRTIQLQTVAEGIETVEQLGELREAGCDLGQGYYFSRPLDGSAIRSYLKAGRPTTQRKSADAGPVLAAVSRSRTAALPA